MTHTNKRVTVLCCPKRLSSSGQLPGGVPVRTAEKGDGWGSHQPTLFPPLPTPRKHHVGENWRRTRLQLLQPDQRNGPGQTGAGKQGHSPLLIFMSQEKVLHLLPSEVELVVIVALNCLGLIHGVVQGQEEFFEGLHYGWWHTQVNLCNAA